MTKQLRPDPKQREFELSVNLERILIEYSTSSPERQLQLRHIIDDKNRQYKQVTGRNYSFRWGDFVYDGRLEK